MARAEYPSDMLFSEAAVGAQPNDPLAIGLAISALAISALAFIVPALTGRQQRLRDDRAKRSEMYLELMELAEGYGLWVVDRTYDLVSTSHEDFVTEMPFRNTPKPERSLRIRLRAIASAYASGAVLEAVTAWQSALEDFELQLDHFAFVEEEEGPHAARYADAEPLRDAEVAARERLADLVNRELVVGRSARGRPKTPVTAEQ